MELAQHRAALEAGADPAIVAGWMKDIQAACLDAEFRMGQIASSAGRRFSRDEVAAMIRELGDMAQLLGDASPERKSKIYCEFGLRLTYHSDQSKVLVSQIPSQMSIGQGSVSEGGLASYVHGRDYWRAAGGSGPVSGRADQWTQRTTIGCVALLAVIAGTVSYLHMHALVALHGQPGWVAALTPLSVDGMIVASSTTLLAESKSGRKGGLLPWALLVIGSIASLAANVAVAEPTLAGRLIAAWPSFALIGSYELLMSQVRRNAPGTPVPAESRSPMRRGAGVAAESSARVGVGQPVSLDMRWEAWKWAVANRAADGSLPSGKVIAAQFGRHERWGRLVKNAGTTTEDLSPAGGIAVSARVSSPSQMSDDSCGGVDTAGRIK